MLAQPREHFKRQCSLVRIREKLYDDHFIERRDEGESRAGEDARQDERKHDAEESSERFGAQNGGGAHQVSVESRQAGADRNDDEDDLLGLYEGVALTERDSHYAGSLPDTITIYRAALLDVCDDEDEVVEEVKITVVHEIAHHFGIDDDRLHELGWA